MDRITVAIAGGSGFIGRAIVRRLGDTARVRVLTRNPDAVRARLAGTGAEFVRADVTDAASLEAVHGFVAQFSEPGMEEARAGLFGLVVDVPEDAPMLDRVIGLTGRDPGWSPG